MNAEKNAQRAAMRAHFRRKYQLSEVWEFSAKRTRSIHASPNLLYRISYYCDSESSHYSLVSISYFFFSGKLRLRNTQFKHKFPSVWKIYQPNFNWFKLIQISNCICTARLYGILQLSLVHIRSCTIQSYSSKPYTLKTELVSVFQCNIPSPSASKCMRARFRCKNKTKGCPLQMYFYWFSNADKHFHYTFRLFNCFFSVFPSILESKGHEPLEVCWRESVTPPWAVEDHSSWNQNQGRQLQPAECLPRP